LKKILLKVQFFREKKNKQKTTTKETKQKTKKTSSTPSFVYFRCFLKATSTRPSLMTPLCKLVSLLKLRIKAPASKLFDRRLH